MIDEQSSASGHDYASDRSAIGAGNNPFRVHPTVGNDSLFVTLATDKTIPSCSSIGIDLGKTRLQLANQPVELAYHTMDFYVKAVLCSEECCCKRYTGKYIYFIFTIICKYRV